MRANATVACPTCGREGLSFHGILDHDSHDIIVRGERRHFTSGEWVIVNDLTKYLGRTIPEARFFNSRIGGNTFRVLLCRIRKKLEGSHLRIITLYGEGLRAEMQ